ncbi:GNAT family N-acetyltransferase [Cellulomonas aerilata]|uniref:N-acetyltransferase n=1 Tax=Cellulomonas aerilata TaxID=515326 RepID=A0A512DF77_9CELL|nr:GNAT family N-acetyltransferase [Cellulomonas aerilata]GEO35086.1 N-acetyltransferase [Cellulomonas aerilata]
MADLGAVAGPTLDVVGWDHPDAAVLRDMQQAEMRELYQDDDEPVPLRDTASITAMVVLRADGVPVACGALRRLSPGSWGDGEPGPGTGEVKRMFVRREWRGRGLSRLVLGELEDRAREQGLNRVVLETGTLQTAAIALYERSGYVPIAPYGGYVHSPLSLCFAKDLTA